MINYGHIKRPEDVPKALGYARRLAKRYKLIEVTGKKSKLKHKVRIGVSEKFYGKGKLVLASNDIDAVGYFTSEYATTLWTKFRIMSEWK